MFFSSKLINLSARIFDLTRIEEKNFFFEKKLFTIFTTSWSQQKKKMRYCREWLLVTSKIEIFRKFFFSKNFGVDLYWSAHFTPLSLNNLLQGRTRLGSPASQELRFGAPDTCKWKLYCYSLSIVQVLWQFSRTFQGQGVFRFVSCGLYTDGYRWSVYEDCVLF